MKFVVWILSLFSIGLHGQNFYVNLSPGLTTRVYEEPIIAESEFVYTDVFFRQRTISPTFSIEGGNTKWRSKLRLSYYTNYSTNKTLFFYSPDSLQSNGIKQFNQYFQVLYFLTLRKVNIGVGYMNTRRLVPNVFYGYDPREPETYQNSFSSHFISFSLAIPYRNFEFLFKYDYLFNISEWNGVTINLPDPLTYSFELAYRIPLMNSNEVESKEDYAFRPNFSVKLGLSANLGSNLRQINPEISPIMWSPLVGVQYYIEKWNINLGYQRQTNIGFSPIIGKALSNHGEWNDFFVGYRFHLSNKRFIDVNLGHMWGFQKVIDWSVDREYEIGFPPPETRRESYTQNYSNRAVILGATFPINRRLDFDIKHYFYYDSKADFLKPISVNNLSLGLNFILF
jgi:hypothetical protein